MASWKLIEYATETIVQVLQAHVDDALPTGNVLVRAATTTTFSELKSTRRPVITVFLYRVLENPELRNAPPRRRPDGAMVRQPMVIELCYMLTPWGARLETTPDADVLATMEEHRLLGLVLQALYDNAEIGRSQLRDDPDPAAPRVWNDVDTMQLVLDTIPIEDLYRIWDASELAYRLSATYRARVLGLESSEVRGAAPVVDGDFRLTGDVR